MAVREAPVGAVEAQAVLVPDHEVVAEEALAAEFEGRRAQEPRVVEEPRWPHDRGHQGVVDRRLVAQSAAALGRASILKPASPRPATPASRAAPTR